MRPIRPSPIAMIAAVALLALPFPVAAQEPIDLEPRPVEVPAQGVQSVVPAGWNELGLGIFARGTPPDDVATLALQAAPMSIEDLWPVLLPQFARSEVPDVTGQLDTPLFEWQLHRFDVSVPGLELAIELALTEDDGGTYLVLLQSLPDEFDALREAVFVPAVEAFAPLRPQPTPDPSTFDYHIEEVTFPGGSDDIELAGTLTLPAGPGPHPVVVVMSGSGPQDRDFDLSPVSQFKPFAVMADALTSAGVGVLRYDDRGVGGSTGHTMSSTIFELADDTAAAIDFLETRTDVDPARIGILGISEGGLRSAILGARDPRIAYIVAMAPPAVDGIDVMLEQLEATALANGQTEEEVGHLKAFYAEFLPLARDGDAAAAEAVALEYFGGLWDRQPESAKAFLGGRDSFAQTYAAAYSDPAREGSFLSAWVRSFLAYDPRPAWEQVTAPTLALFGSKDVQVLAEQNAPVLREALETAGNEDYEIVVLPEANHLFQAADNGGTTEYLTLAPEFAPEVLPLVVDWVTQRAGVAE